MYTRIVNFNVNSNYNKYKSNKKNHTNPSFSGHILKKDSHGNNVYTFFLPNAPKGSKVILTRLEDNGNKEFTSPSPIVNGKRAFKTIEKELTGTVPSYSLYADDFNLDAGSVIGYKFKINGQEKCTYDNTAKAFINGIGNEEGTFTIATPLWTANSTKPRVIEHIVPDSFNVNEDVKAKRNHFNRLGGTIESVRDKINTLKTNGITAILGTPLFGLDHSSHGYWTLNPYQITEELGNVTKFKNLMLDLYKNDMRWIADGAFVNEGVQGIHVSDIAYWGDKSPAVDMFETKDLENLPIRFGALSKNPAISKHIHLKPVNAPYKIVFEKDQDGHYIEKEVKKNESFNPSKPSFVQLFDDRLASLEQMNGDFVFSVYAKKETDNNFEISNYRDSVQPYYHKVTSQEVVDNYKKYKEVHSIDKSIEFKNLLTKWTNFEFVESNKDGGIALWVGNSDISKKRFITPENALPEGLSQDRYKQKMAAQYQVQDDTLQVGKFWTNEVARTLVEYTARTIKEKMNSSENKLTYHQAVESLIKEGKLPDTAEAILEKDSENLSPLDNILAVNMWGDGRDYKLTATKMPENVADGMMSYPFESIEFSPDLVSVFSYPYIKNLAVSEDTVGKSRYDFYKMGDKYYEMMPDRYRDLYKKSDKFIAQDMTNQAESILHKLSQKLGKQLVLENGKLTEEGKEIYSLIYPDIAKFLIVSSLNPQIKPDYKNTKMLEYNVSDLKNISFNSLNLQYEETPHDAAESLINKLQTGINEIPADSIDNFVNHLFKRLKDIDSDSINVAKLIIEQTESGLDWRIDAAKDVGDFESVEDGVLDRDANINHIMDFWKKFNKAVREYNPRSYTIGELTDWEANELEFVPKTEFSTVSDYKYFYSFLPKLYGKNSDAETEDKYREKVYDKLNEFLNSGYAETVNFAHRFVGNHDKPRMLHVFSLDASGFKDKNMLQKPALMKQVLENAFKNTNDFYNGLSEENKNAIMNALKSLSEGHVTVNGVNTKFDSENFGIRPFDFNIESVIKQAVETDSGFADFAKNNADIINKLKAKTLENILKDNAMKRFRAMWFAMNAIPGAPTMYAGDELGMTGWETFAKNEHQDNRNRLPWEWLGKEEYKFIKEFNDNINAITKIRSKEAASPLVNGTTVTLAAPSKDSVAFYRYNDKTDAICVIQADAFKNNNLDKNYNLTVTRLDLSGLPAGLQVGTIYHNALNFDDKYKVTNPYEIKKIDDNGNIQEQINLGDAGLILLRDTDFYGKDISFKGRVENPNVKLANTKYNFSKFSLSDKTK